MGVVGLLLADIAGFAIDPLCVDGGCRVTGGLGILSRWVTHFGEGYETLVPAGLCLLVCLLAPRVTPGRLAPDALTRWGWRAWFVLASVGGTGIIASLVKNSIGRARPSTATSGDPYVFHVLQFKPAFASLPSGHATTAGATAMLLTLICPRLWPVFLGAGMAIALSRVALGAHYPSDVLAGYTFGAAGTLALALLFAGWGRVFRPASGDERLPRLAGD
jgi:membrane-associated phospholipid phosphatase